MLIITLANDLRIQNRNQINKPGEYFEKSGKRENIEPGMYSQESRQSDGIKTTIMALMIMMIMKMMIMMI